MSSHFILSHYYEIYALINVAFFHPVDTNQLIFMAHGTLLVKQQYEVGKEDLVLKKCICSIHQKHSCSVHRKHSCSVHQKHSCSVHQKHSCSVHQKHSCSVHQKHSCSVHQKHSCSVNQSRISKVNNNFYFT